MQNKSVFKVFLVMGTSDIALDVDIGRDDAKLVPTSKADIEYTK